MTAAEPAAARPTRLAGVVVAGPARTCVGCRRHAGRTELLRVVAVEGALVPDPRRRLPGRGAYVHPDSACLDLADRRRAWSRALRQGPLSSRQVRAHLDGPQAAAGPAPEAGPVDGFAQHRSDE